MRGLFVGERAAPFLPRRDGVKPSLPREDPPDTSQDDAHDLSRQVAAFDAALDGLREAHAGETAALLGRTEAAEKALADAHHERDRERERAEAADADRRAAIGLAEQTVALLKEAEARVGAERGHADMLRDRLNAMQEQLTEAHAALEAAASADARAERAERDKDQAEAGRDAERMRADRAEQGREGDRARADGLQAKLDDMQVQLTARQEVVDAAEAIRKAADTRLARSRWARLRAAWKGE